MNYDAFLTSKAAKAPMRGLSNVPELGSHLFPHQQATVDYLLRCGSGAAFLDTGLGKTACEIEFARVVAEHTNMPVLIFAPLAVAKQHQREAERFGVEVKIASSQSDVTGAGVYITNYQKLKHFDASRFSCVVLDESSILKSYGGKTSLALMDFAKAMRFRLAATATPAPNDYMELGQHSEFLGVMSSSEMLARWFITDQSEMGKYRLKKHGTRDFWSWVASWARCVGLPSDLGFDDAGYILPALNENLMIIKSDMTTGAENGELFRSVEMSATSIHKEKRITSQARAAAVAGLIKQEPNEAWMVWVETDYDAEAFKEAFPDVIEVRGNMTPEMKEERLTAFTDGEIKYLLSKPSIAGMGLNWQHCARTAFAGLSFSYEQYYQAIRRFWRFGQKREVQAHIAMAESEQAIWKTIKRKKAEHETMKIEMFEAMRRECVTREVRIAYNAKQQAKMPAFLRTAA